MKHIMYCFSVTALPLPFFASVDELDKTHSLSPLDGEFFLTFADVCSTRAEC